MKDNAISSERLVRLVRASYYDMKEETNEKPLAVASMVISTVAKAMMESTFNKVLVLRCLGYIAIKEKNLELDNYMHSLIQDAVTSLSSLEKDSLFHSVEATISSSRVE